MTDEAYKEEREIRWLVAAAFFAAIAIRMTLLPFGSWDAETYFVPWLKYVAVHGHWHALGTPFSNYPPMYLYFLVVLSYFDRYLPALLLIKFLTFPFEVFAAWIAYKIVQFLQSEQANGLENKMRPISASIAVLLAPTLVLNGACWGQSDAIYTSFLLAAIYCSLSGRSWWAALSFAAALSFKLQSVFLLPFLVLMVLLKRLNWRPFLIVPAVWIVAAIPMMLEGRPVVDVLGIFINQIGQYPALASNAVNPWFFLTTHFPYSTAAAVLGTIAGGLASGWFVLLGLRRHRVTSEWLFLAAVFQLTLLPFILPRMHDRYFFPAELTLIVLGVCQPRFALHAICLQASAMVAYAAFFEQAVNTRTVQIGKALAIVVNLVVVASLGRQYLMSISQTAEPRNRVVPSLDQR